MLRVVYMAQTKDTADRIRDLLTMEGFLIKIKPVYRNVSEEENYYEILVPQTEVESAYHINGKRLLNIRNLGERQHEENRFDKRRDAPHECSNKGSCQDGCIQRHGGIWCSQGFSRINQGEIEHMDVKSVGEILHRGGTILNTARSDQFKTEEGMGKALNILRVFGIEGLVVIGGDGSFRGALDLSERGFPTVGVPGTIDNDIACTEQTIGFDTANTVLEAINKMRYRVFSRKNKYYRSDGPGCR